MSMTRNKIEAAKMMAQEFIERCDAAMDQLDLEARRNTWAADSPGQSTPNDYSYGSKRTGALRRRSMDLTRILAELRK
jgi:hypothetical protein